MNENALYQVFESIFIELLNKHAQYYANLDLNKISDNKQFWQAIKPIFSDKSKCNQKIIIVEGDSIISNDDIIANLMNRFFF